MGTGWNAAGQYAQRGERFTLAKRRKAKRRKEEDSAGFGIHRKEVANGFHAPSIEYEPQRVNLQRKESRQ